MGAAVALGDVVGERQHILVVAVVPPQRDLDPYAIALAPDENWAADQRGFGAVEVAHKRFETAFIMKVLALGLGVTQIGQHDMHARVEEGEFAQAMLDCRIVELDHGERLGRGGEGDFSPAPRPAVDQWRGPHHLERLDRVAVGEADDILEAVAPDAQHKRRRQGVHDRDADAVQPARHFVGVLIEFPAGVQLSHDDLSRRNALFLVDFRSGRRGRRR